NPCWTQCRRSFLSARGSSGNWASNATATPAIRPTNAFMRFLREVLSAGSSLGGANRRVEMSARFLRAGLAVVACLVSLAPAGVGANGIPANSRVTQDNQAGSYTRYDGGTDATMTDCSTNKRAQNEPTVAVD